MDNLDKDILETLANRDSLENNPNLLYWYKFLFKTQFSISQFEPRNSQILEIGSGTSPMKSHYPNVLTSDIMALDYLDFQFDALEIDVCEELKGMSFDIIVMTNVLHHLKDPLLFLIKASGKLRPGGKIIFTEPYFSILSYPIYKLLHHEASIFTGIRPVLDNIKGPLSTSNMANPYMVFFSRNEWLKEVFPYFKSKEISISYYTGISYFLTGGISRRIPFPEIIFRWIFKMDLKIASLFPRWWASFFTVSLTKK